MKRRILLWFADKADRVAHVLDTWSYNMRDRLNPCADCGRPMSGPPCKGA